MVHNFKTENNAISHNDGSDRFDFSGSPECKRNQNDKEIASQITTDKTTKGTIKSDHEVTKND